MQLYYYNTSVSSVSYFPTFPTKVHIFPAIGRAVPTFLLFGVFRQNYTKIA